MTRADIPFRPEDLELSPTEYWDILRQDFVAFITRAFAELNPTTRLLMAEYIEVMAARLEDCRQGRLRRLIINLPPRYLKSHCASIAFVAWLLGHDPSARVICASYGQDLADKLALDTRKLMQSKWYQHLFATRISASKQAVGDFETIDGGGRFATSVGGALTGRGADFVVIDDPIKPEDALVDSKRLGANNWYDSTLLSRLNNKVTGCIILIMQRLHQDDLVAHVLAKEPWAVVNFPAICEGDETFVYRSAFGEHVWRRKEGEPLHAERETLTMLRSTRERIGEYNFSSQYQQNPTPQGGAMVKANWLMRYDALPDAAGSYVLQSWDTANKAGELNDYSVCTTWRYTDGRYYLVDVLRKRMDYLALKQAVIDQSERFRPNRVLIEDKSSGTSLIQELKGRCRAPIEGYLPPSGQDKIIRLHLQADLFEGGKVFVPRQAPWLEDYERELLTFPGSKYDDQVDSTSQALDFLKKKLAASLAVWSKLAKVA